MKCVIKYKSLIFNFKTIWWSLNATLIYQWDRIKLYFDPCPIGCKPDIRRKYLILSICIDIWYYIIDIVRQWPRKARLRHLSVRLTVRLAVKFQAGKAWKNPDFFKLFNQASRDPKLSRFVRNDRNCFMSPSDVWHNRLIWQLNLKFKMYSSR